MIRNSIPLLGTYRRTFWELLLWLCPDLDLSQTFQRANKHQPENPPSRSLRHQATSTSLVTLSSLFEVRKQSSCLLHEKTFGRSLGANNLSSPDSGLDRLKLACHWLGAIKEIAHWDMTDTGNHVRKTSGIYCVKLNSNISKLVYCNSCFYLCFKTWLGAQPLIWKRDFFCAFIVIHIKFISIWKVVHQDWFFCWRISESYANPRQALGFSLLSSLKLSQTPSC